MAKRTIAISGLRAEIAVLGLTSFAKLVIPEVSSHLHAELCSKISRPEEVDQPRDPEDDDEDDGGDRESPVDQDLDQSSPAPVNQR